MAGPKPAVLLELFEDLADRLDIRLVNGKGSFQGGPCLVNGERVIVINKQKPVEQRLRVLAESFGNMDLTDVYLKPVLRACISDYRDRLFPVKETKKS
ncbi:MAG: hypothetical protein ACE5D8_05255 [Fidelibacterota bacterium]